MVDGAGGTVCITGVTGLIGSKVLEVFVKGEGAGRFKVRATVRNKDNQEKMRPLKNYLGAAYDDIEFVNADLMNEESIRAAVEGCQYIVHTASPVLMGGKVKNPDEHIKPAVNGTTYIMNAAKAAGVKRVVITSSIAAVAGQDTANMPLELSESHWSDEKFISYDSYVLSKTRAEKAAWELSKQSGVELATIMPSITVGHFYMHTGQSSTEIVAKMMRGEMPYLPKVMGPVVDTEDVALAHYRALVTPEAAGRRFILSIDKAPFFSDLGIMLGEGLKENGFTKFKTPSGEVSYCCLAFFAPCSKDARGAKNLHGKVIRLDNSPAKNILGIQFAKTPKELLTITGMELIKQGIVAPK